MLTRTHECQMLFVTNLCPQRGHFHKGRFERMVVCLGKTYGLNAEQGVGA